MYNMNSTPDICSLCSRQGASVIDVNRGAKKIYMCSYEWNNWLEIILGDDPEGTLVDFLVLPEGCEDPDSPTNKPVFTGSHQTPRN